MRFPLDRLAAIRPDFSAIRIPSLTWRPLHPGVWAGMGVLCLLMFSVWTQARVDRLSMALETEHSRTRSLQSLMEIRSQQTLRFSSLREVEPHATEELGLIPSRFDRITVLDIREQARRSGPGFDVIVPEANASDLGASR